MCQSGEQGGSSKERLAFSGDLVEESELQTDLRNDQKRSVA